MTYNDFDVEQCVEHEKAEHERDHVSVRQAGHEKDARPVQQDVKNFLQQEWLQDVRARVTPAADELSKVRRKLALQQRNASQHDHAETREWAESLLRHQKIPFHGVILNQYTHDPNASAAIN